MKKFKLFNILLALMLVFTMPVVYAHDIETDEDVITIEPVIDNNIYSGSKINVASSFGEYTLYYQYVQISNDDYKSYRTILEEALKYQEEENPGSSASDKDKEAYEEELQTYNDSMQEILPGYDEDKWVETTDGTIELDLTKVPENSEFGEQPYVLWIKVVSKSDDTKISYSDEVVLAKRQVVSTDESNEENAKTGDEIIYIALGAVALAGIMVISYKKANA